MTFEAARQLELPEGWTVEPDATSSVVEVDPPEDDLAALEAEDPPIGWALDAVRAARAWKLTPPPGGRAMGMGVLIGQPDTGFTDHPELAGDALDLLRDYDVLTGSDEARAVLAGFPPLQFPSHGTSTASVAVSRQALEITGSAPRARIVPIRAAETVVHIRNAELAVAVNHARLVGCHVITISMGGIAYPGSLRAAIRRAVDDGLIVMAAAGQPLPMVVQPASYPECLAVAGTRLDDEPWNLSARGSQVDWCAPAKAVWVAATSNDPGPEQFHIAPHAGTSFAVALSAGVAALWLAHHGRDAIVQRFGAPNVQAAFRDLVRRTARKPAGWDERRWGAGIIDAEALLSASLDDVRLAPAGDAEPPPRFRWLLDRAAELAGEDSAEQAQANVAALFGGDETLMDRHADEVVYRLAQHPAVRDEVLLAPAAATALEDGGGAPSLRALASPSLLAALG
jgi:subtilisin family serine protease